MATIIDSGQSMLQILNDILDFSKIDAGKLFLDPHSFNLFEQLTSVFELYKVKAGERGNKIFLNIDESSPKFVVGDSIRIRQIIHNLVNNSIKFTENGKIDIRVKHQSSKNNLCQLLFEVEDSGIGIDVNDQQQLFKEFTQADLSTTRKFGGTGLGLAICQRLVGMLGSEIRVKSAPNQGSLFYFVLELPIAASP